MGLEVATYIHELNPANPVGAADPKSQGDDHIRLLKDTLQNTFANVDGAVTSSHTELNILDGATLSTAELNILDGVTATAAELNVTDGLTASTAELNKMDGVTASTADLNKTSTLDAASFAATIVNVLGVSSIVDQGHFYQRIGSIVTVYGKFTCTPTGSAQNTVDITPPIASNFTVAAHAIGIGGNFGAGNEVTAHIEAEPTGNNMRLSWIPTSGSSQTVQYSCQYIIL